MASGRQDSISGIEKDFDHLKNIFGDKTKFKEVVIQLFESQTDPYLYFLQLVRLSESVKSGKPSELLSEIFSSFESWTKKSTNPTPTSVKLQKSALQLAMNSGDGDVLQTISRIFQISGTNSTDVIDEHYRKGNLEMVAQAVKVYNLQELYGFDGLYFPLVCFDLKNELKNLFQNSRDLKLQFIKNMDALYITQRKMNLAIQSVEERFSTKRLKLNHNSDPIKKEPRYYRQVMNEFLREWDIPVENCVNYMKEKRRVAISYLVAIFRNEEISIEGLVEMAVVAIGTEKDLIKFMVDKLNKFDVDAARIVNAKARNPRPNQPIHYAKSARASDGDFLKFSLNETDIIFVDNRAAYERSIEDISKSKEIGFDTEWQPTFGWGKEKIALLQIATWNKVYLFDVLSLTEHLTNNWDSLVKKVFHNTDILKVGFAIRSDLDHFNESFRGSTQELAAKKLEKFMDLRFFFSWVLKLDPKIRQAFGLPDVVNEKSSDKNKEANPGSSKKSNGGRKSTDGRKDVDEDGVIKGLSGSCELVLGKPLNKLHQISDWERRPLRDAQKLYAALDAFCLLQILQRVEAVLNKMGFKKTDVIQKFFEEEEKKKSEAQ